MMNEMDNPFEGKRVIFVEDENEPENADGKRGHLTATGDISCRETFYEAVVKRIIDICLAFGGIIVLSPLFIVTAIAIFINDPGPVLFAQKRIGKNKKYFKLYKFRSMKMSTPHDRPTHMLENPEQYITRVGKFIRKYSIDEIPQFFNVLFADMSVIGPRPALWNQDVLVAERDKYGANNVRPGISGLAQSRGRDSISIRKKARMDGKYTQILKKGGLKPFLFDCRLFFETFSSVARHDGVVEGGTGKDT